MNYKIFPTLYKKNSKGGIERWTIRVDRNLKTYGQITKTYGETNGKLYTPTPDIITEGKNIGKKNETNAFEQAAIEAEAQWTKKLKSGYVKSIESADSGEQDSIITGGVPPMLAKSYEDDGGKIKFPCAGQPKLDGIRCIAVKSGQTVNLFSRTQKPITSCPHIIQGILEVFNGVDGTFDGELYNHDLKDNFEAIVSAVRKVEPSGESEKVQYHIYDIIEDKTFEHRVDYLFSLVNGHHDSIKIVETEVIEDSQQVNERHDTYQEMGYEGLMLRNHHGKYEQGKRSAHLQKVKVFKDAEFKITGIEEGRGKLQGNVGAFICEDARGQSFKAKPAGTQETTKAYFENPKSVIGRLLTVQYFGLTGKNGVPRFPVGLRIREEGL